MEQTPPIRLLLADDDAEFLAALADFLQADPDFTVAARASDGDRALALSSERLIDVAVLDMDMPGLSGLEVAQQMLAAQLNVRVLILTSFEDPATVAPAIAAGVLGFITKADFASKLPEAIRAVYARRRTLDAQTGAALADSVFATRIAAAPDPDFTQIVEGLSPQLRRVYAMVVQAQSNKAIAVACDLKEATVRDYVSQILAKTGVLSRTELVVKAFSTGLTS